MVMIIRFLWRNIIEKKTRTCLIVFSIAIAGALFFASMAITDTAMAMYVKQVQSSSGSMELVIQPNDRSPARYFNLPIPQEFQKHIAYTIGVVETDAVYRHRKDETVLFNLKGIDWIDLEKMSPISLAKDAGVLPFAGKKAIVSEYYAGKYGLKTGGILELDLGPNRYRFRIAAIAKSSGIFTGADNLVILPKDTLSGICSQKGNVSKLYLKLKNPAEKARIMAGLSGLMRRYDVREAISDQEFRESTEMLSTTLSITLVVVIFLSIFIIYTSFKVITAERLPVIGSFRSIGANRKTTDLILLAESGVYGIIGGIAGCVLGLGVLYLMALAMAEMPHGGTAQVSLNFNLTQLAVTFWVALGLSLASSAVPILQVSKMPVKNIVLNIPDRKNLSTGRTRLFVGVLCIVSVLIMPPMVDGDIGLLTDALCIGLSVLACILMTPFVTVWFLKCFEIITEKLFGPVGLLAAKNMRGNKNALNSIVLLAIGTSTILMVNTIGSSVLTGMSDFTAQTVKYELTLVLPKMDRTVEPGTRATEGVTGVYGAYITGDVPVQGSAERIGVLEGVDNSRFQDFKRITRASEPIIPLLNELNYSRNIIVTHLLKNRYNVKKGDTLTLRLNNKDFDYKVIGFIDTMEGGGSYALISDRYFKADTGQVYYSELAVKTGPSQNPDEVLRRLRNKFSRNNPSGNTTLEHQQRMTSEIGGILAILNGFSVITALIGLFGLINNLMISFMERKRSLAMLRSVGASKKQTVQMIMLEGAGSGIIGAIIGILTGVSMISVMPYFMRAIVATIPMKYSSSLFITTAAAGVFVTLIASVVPSLKSSKLNIIESLKYE